jgi:hypothetical protein
LRPSTRDGHEISDGSGTLISVVRKANLSGQRRTLDWNEHHALGMKTAHGLRYKRDTEAGGYHRNRRCYLWRLLCQVWTESGVGKGRENAIIDKWINCACE